MCIGREVQVAGKLCIPIKPVPVPIVFLVYSLAIFRFH